MARKKSRKNPKLRRSGHNKDTHKYERQRMRTEARKARDRMRKIGKNSS